MKHLYLAVVIVGWTMALDSNLPASPPLRTRSLESDDEQAPAKRSIGLIGPILSGLTSLAGGSVGSDHSGGASNDNFGGGNGLMGLIGALFNNGMGVSFGQDGINMNLKPQQSNPISSDGFGSDSFDRSQQRDSGAASSSSSPSSAASVQSLNGGGIGLNFDLTKIGSNLAHGYRMGKAAGSTGGSILSSLLGLGSAASSLFAQQTPLPPGPPPSLQQPNSLFPPPPFPLPQRGHFEQLPPPPPLHHSPQQSQHHFEHVPRPDQLPPPPFHHLPPPPPPPPQDPFGRAAGRPEPLPQSEPDGPPSSSSIGKHQFLQDDQQHQPHQQQHEQHRDNVHLGFDEAGEPHGPPSWPSDSLKATATARRPNKEQRKTRNKNKGRASSSSSKESSHGNGNGNGQEDDGVEREFSSSPRTRTGKKSGHRNRQPSSVSLPLPSSSPTTSSSVRHADKNRDGMDHQDFVVAEVVPSSFPHAILTDMVAMPIVAEFRDADTGSSKPQEQHNANHQQPDFAGVGNNDNNNNNNNNGDEAMRFHDNTFGMVTDASAAPGADGGLHQTIHPDHRHQQHLHGPGDSRIFNVEMVPNGPPESLSNSAVTPFAQPSYVSQVPAGLFQVAKDDSSFASGDQVRSSTFNEGLFVMPDSHHQFNLHDNMNINEDNRNFNINNNNDHINNNHNSFQGL